MTSITGMGLLTSCCRSSADLWHAAAMQESNLAIDPSLGMPVGVVHEDELKAASSWCATRPEFTQFSDFLTPSHPRFKPMTMFLYAIWQAMNDAGWTQLDDQTGIVFATTTGYLPFWEKQVASLATGKLSPAAFRAHFHDHALSTPVEILRARLQIRSPFQVVVSACSAGTQALILAHDWLEHGFVRRVLVCGAELLCDLTLRGFGSFNLTSAKLAAPFAQGRDGINLAEGSAALCLEASSLHLKDFTQFGSAKAHGYILGGATALDAFDMTSPDPVGKGILKSMTNALRQAHCSSVSIDWVHAHGTGSFANDLAEANALHEFFESSSPPVTSTKAVHGHALGISGLLETQLCVESLQREILLPTMNCQEVDSKIRVPILRVKESRPTLRRILKTTLGFGGVNAALVLGKMEPL